MTVNAALKIAILQENTTQKAVAEAAGVNPSILSGIVRGWYNADDDQKKAIAKALHRKVHDLFPEVAA
jgi:transcriptional regulator with XRE-family HTH domain